MDNRKLSKVLSFIVGVPSFGYMCKEPFSPPLAPKIEVPLWTKKVNSTLFTLSFLRRGGVISGDTVSGEKKVTVCGLVFLFLSELPDWEESTLMLWSLQW